jgi:hypothetical protein
MDRVGKSRSDSLLPVFRVTKLASFSICVTLVEINEIHNDRGLLVVCGAIDRVHRKQ